MSSEARGRHLDELLANTGTDGAPAYALVGSRPERLPAYASVIGSNAPITDPRELTAARDVVLHDTLDRPCDDGDPWMACYALDTG